MKHFIRTFAVLLLSVSLLLFSSCGNLVEYTGPLFGTTSDSPVAPIRFDIRIPAPVIPSSAAVQPTPAPIILPSQAPAVNPAPPVISVPATAPSPSVPAADPSGSVPQVMVPAGDANVPVSPVLPSAGTAEISAPTAQTPVQAVSGGSAYQEHSFFYKKLSDGQKANFNALYNGLLNYDTNISIPSAVTANELNELINLMLNECPELMQMTSWQSAQNPLGSILYVTPSYSMDAVTYQQKRAAVENILSVLHSQLDGTGQYNCELTLYSHIINNCVYTLDTADCANAYGALALGQAKCDGRAKALLWALRSFGINSSILTGNNHAWIVAEIDGFVYNVDPTYDDTEENGVQYACTYAHFNVPESSIYNDPYPVDAVYQKLGYPQTVRWDANYHVRTGNWVYTGSNGYDLFQAQLAQAAQNKKGIINLRYESHEDFILALSSYSEWIQAYLNQIQGGCSIKLYNLDQKSILFLELTFE